MSTPTPQEQVAALQEQLIQIRKRGDRVESRQDNRPAECEILGKLGIAYYQGQQWHSTLTTLTEYLNLARELGNQANEAVAHYYLGLTQQAIAEFEAAVAAFFQGYRLFRQLQQHQFAAQLWQQLVQQGQRYFQNQQFPEAIALYKQQIQVLLEFDDIKASAEIAVELGKLYYYQPDFPQAIACFTSVLDTAQTLKEPTLENQALAWLGCSYWQSGDLEQGLQYLERRLALVQQLEDTAAQQETLTWVIQICQQLDRPDKLIQSYQFQANLWQQQGDAVNQQFSLYELARYQFNRQQYSEALSGFQVALELAKTLSDEQGKSWKTASAHYMLGECYRNLGENQPAISHYEQAVDVYLQLGVKDWAEKGLEHLVKLYRELQQAETEIDCQKKRLQLIQDRGDDIAAYSLAYEIGNLYNNRQQFTQALEYYQEALIFAKKLEQQHNLGNAAYMVANCYRNLGQQEPAISHYEQAVGLYVELKETQWALSGLEYLVSLYRELKQDEQVIASYQRRVEIFRETGDRISEQSCLYKLAMFQFDCQKYQEASSGFETALQIAETLDEDSQKSYKIANARYMAGQCCRNLGQQEAAIYWYEQALGLYLEVKETQWALSGLEYLVSLYGELKQDEQVIASYQRRVEIFRETGDRISEQSCLYKLAMFQFDCQKYQEALSGFETALQIAESLEEGSDRTYKIASSRYMLGRCYEKLEQFYNAIENYQLSSQLYREVNDIKWMATPSHSTANIYLYDYPIEKAESIEKAIAIFQDNLTAYSRETYPQDWAKTQNALGNAYFKRIRGNKAENLETAIRHYETALEVYTREAYPQDWAGMHNDLGIAYKNRIQGDKAENLETAIRYYEAALEVYTREKYPQDWAGIQNNLAIAYRNGIQGERGENLERVIHCYKAALEVNTREADPEKWASLQNQLGNIYSDDVTGDKAENLETAIRYYEAALEVYTREEYPQDWAMVQFNLGGTYRDRIKGEKLENCHRAIACYEAALEVRTREAYPEKWASLQNRLGNIYFDDVPGDKAENLETAIRHYEAALEVYTRDKYPQDWATTQNNLGFAYRTRIQGERGEKLERAINCYKAALEVYTREVDPERWASLQNQLGNIYSDNVSGDKAENLEIAIGYYESTLEVRTRSAYPEDWAMTQNNLGFTYRNRIKGERAENLERAISCYKAALEVRTRSAYPEDWAMTQNNLGDAYYHRIRGERAENLEREIICYEATLTVYTPSAYPEKWAGTQNNLGNAYSKRIQGERAENLEREIYCYKQALEVYTYSAYPEYWADTQNNLGLAYRNRIKGERAENLEREIYCYKQALEVYTRSAYPKDWAMTQNNLGSAYRNRIKGERAENLERTIWYYGAALEVITRSAYPKDWAGLNNNLGLAYSDRIQGDQSENLEQAITYYQAALKVYTRDAYLEHWAMIQNNLGSTYLKRIRGDKKENLEWSIICYESALKGYTRDAFPQDWAMTQSNLGSAYLNRIQGERDKNLEQSIACLQSALEVRSRTDFIHDYTATLFNMALAYRYQSIYYANNQPKKQIALEKAYITGEEIIDAVEYLRGEISSGDEVKRKLNEQWVELYVLMVKVCIELNRHDKALEYADRSKARNLSELIAVRDLYGSDIPESTRLRLQQIRQDIAKEKERLQQTSQPNSHHLNQLREEFNRLSPYQAMTFKSIKNLLNEETAIIEWYVSFTSNQFLAFTILPTFTNQSSQADSGISLWQSSPEDFKNLIDWGESYLHDYIDNKTQWHNNLPQRLEQLAQILHLDKILHNLREKFPNCKKLILIPHRFLHLFPLHALPVPVIATDGVGAQCLRPISRQNGNQKGASIAPLQELFPKGVAYAPNCQVLQQAQNRQRPNFNQLFAIQNPTKDLDFTDIEVVAIQSLFNPHHILQYDAAEKAAILDWDNLKNAHCIHFSCHGYFNFEDALKSALLLAKSEFTPPPPSEDQTRYLPLQNGNFLDLDKCLTLEDILRLDLTKCRLVTLSACETGITDFTSTSDEYIGLPSGFILAGSPNVVSSLWAVNDLSTALLMIRFYQNLKNGETVPLSLREAQIWLRDATVEALQVWSEPILDPFSQEELRSRLSKIDSRSKPFASPYYWAGFCAIGA